MEIWLNKDWLKFFHETLVNLYRDAEYPITLGHSEGMLEVCVERPLVSIYDFIPFPHILHKATILMETMICFHPFIDGNKRTALLSVFFFLYWNGYNLHIPEDAADFTIEIAKGKHNFNSILYWLSRNTSRTLSSIFRNKLLYIWVWLCEKWVGFETVLVGFIGPIIGSPYPYLFFQYLITKKVKKKQT